MPELFFSKAPAKPQHSKKGAFWALISVFLFALTACGPLGDLWPSGQSDAARSLRGGAVAMPDVHSAKAAGDVLAQGGNAIDAAVAAGFVLSVTLPEAGNVGGGGFMMVHKDGKSNFLDYRETAPAAASRDMYLDEEGNVIRRASLLGPLASGTPGTVWGLWAAHQKYGHLPWEALLAPAIALAQDGFVPDEELVGNAARALGYLGPKTNFADYFSNLKEGQIFRQPELAMTLRAIAAEGPNGFYKGKIADLIVAEMQKDGGLITHDDLASYRPKWRRPLTASWHGMTVLSAPPPSSGGIALVQLLKMKQARADLFDGVAHNSTDYVHLVAEIEKRVFADRAHYLGDPDFFDVPVKALTDENYIRARAAEIDPVNISAAQNVKPGLKESEQTTHYSIIDAKGNAVSNTYTLNLGFGSGVVITGAGFLMNNEMDDFSAKPGAPNAFGAIGDKANEIAPRKRMLSSMSPTILLDNKGAVKMVVGTPGGTTIFTSVFQVISNVFDYDMSLADAVAAPRFHHQLPAALRIASEAQFPLAPDVIQALTEKGYDVPVNKRRGHIGDVHAILVEEDGTLSAASDPRGRGEARLVQPEKSAP